MSCLETLRSRGHKLTPQRRLIIEMLHERSEHLTAERIISRVQGAMPGVNKSTIYRTLDLLEHTGCVIKRQMGEHLVYDHAQDVHHHHLVCISCGRTIECPEDIFRDTRRRLADTYGFRADFTHLVVEGMCLACQKANETAKPRLQKNGTADQRMNT